MRWLLTAALVLTAHAALAQTEAPARVTRVITRTVFQPDGTAETVSEFAFKVFTDAAARSNAQVPLPYSPSLESIEVISAETRKADGRRLPVAADQIQERLAPAAANAIEFSDQRIKTVVFPDVAAGDQMVLTLRRRLLRPYFAGKIASSGVYANLPWDDVETTLVMPPGMTLQTQVRGVSLQTEVEDGHTVYHFTARNIPLDTRQHALAPADVAPMYSASNFKDWEELGAGFARLNKAKAAVTPKIQALADQIVKGASDRRDEARRLGEYVATHIRYISVLLGLSGFEGHDAETIVAHGYGDCKDHTILLSALLAARHIASDMVLINLGNAYQEPEVPTLSAFNHVISYLPEFSLYVDTTAGGAPFGVLPFSEYGKHVLHVSEQAVTRRVVPVLAEADNVVELRTQAFLNTEGVMTGTTTTTASGPFSWSLRTTLRALQTQTNAATGLLSRIGQPGSGVFARYDAETLTPSLSVSGQFTLDARKEDLDGDAFPLPTGLRIIARPGDFLLGPLFQRPLGAQESVPCWSGRQTESLSLTLPAGRRPERLPKSVSVEKDSLIIGDGLRFSSQWRQDGDVVSVTRRFSAHVTSALCGPALRVELAPALDQIRAELNRKITIADP